MYQALTIILKFHDKRTRIEKSILVFWFSRKISKKSYTTCACGGRILKIHELKLDVKYFDDVKSGKKNFEIRNNDRDFQIGDILELKAFKDGKYAFRNKDNIWTAYGRSAEIVKVKVVEIISAEQLNKIQWDDDTIAAMHNIGWAYVMEVLLDFWDTYGMPEGYVLMEVEVIEWTSDEILGGIGQHEKTKQCIKAEIEEVTDE